MSFCTSCIRHSFKRRALSPTQHRRSYAIPVTSTSSSSTSSSASPRASSSNLPPSNAYAVFDRNVKKLQKDRSVRRDVEHSRLADYVKDEVASNLVDRLLDIKKRYPAIVDFGSGAGHLIKHLDRDITQKVIMCDSSEELLNRDKEIEYDVDVERIVLDEEDFLHKTLQADSQDVVISNLALHWINDLPGTLIQIRQVLKEDGVFIGALLGGDSLFELRTALQLAELEREGGISPRVSPMTDSRQMSSLLSRAGFSLPAVDVDEITINYPSIFELMDDLRFMGQSNAVTLRRHTIKRDTLIAADAIYRALHGNEDGTLPATFQIIFSIGWKPSASQPKPLKRGSAQKSLKEALDANTEPKPEEPKLPEEGEETPLAPDDSEGGKGSDAGGNAEDAEIVEKKP